MMFCHRPRVSTVAFAEVDYDKSLGNAKPTTPGNSTQGVWLRLVRCPAGGSGSGAHRTTRVRSAGFLRRRIPSPKIQTVCSSRPHGRGMRGL
jgi:hypothetical protein